MNRSEAEAELTHQPGAPRRSRGCVYCTAEYRGFSIVQCSLPVTSSKDPLKDAHLQVSFLLDSSPTSRSSGKESCKDCRYVSTKVERLPIYLPHDWRRSSFRHKGAVRPLVDPSGLSAVCTNNNIRPVAFSVVIKECATGMACHSRVRLQASRAVVVEHITATNHPPQTPRPAPPSGSTNHAPKDP